MTLIEVQNKRQVAFDEMQAIISGGEKEVRKLQETEATRVNELKSIIENCDAEIKSIQEQDNKTNITSKNNSTIRNKNMENSILLKTIRDAAEGRPFDERSIELLNEGRNTFSKSGLSYKGQIVLPTKFESRANILAGTGNAGQEIVTEDKFGLIGKLYATSVVFNAGAQLMTNLTGDISIPVYAGTGSGWATEVGAKSESGGTFSEVTLAPKRLTTILLVSRQFLAQDSVSAEQVLINDMRNSIMATLESSILDATASSTSRPAGMLNGVSYTSTGSTDWTKVVALETAVNTSNALMGGLAYISTPALKGKMKVTSKDSGSGIFIASEGNVVNGYSLYATSAMASGKVIFGNFNDLLVGNWGGMDVLVNPYTYAKTGQVELVINTYWSWAKRRSESFAYANLT
jgi:HK97 family phage major capsid protein